MRQINLFKLVLFVALLLVVGITFAKPGDLDRGKEIYDKRCTWCHGDEGDGLGAAEGYVNPPPRDFTSGNYKIKSSGFDEMVPNDDDVYRMIRDGMPGTSMPGWSSLLSEQDMWDLVAYVKMFAEFEEAPEQQVDYGTPVASSAESIAKGKELFEDGDRCVECHGKTGKGDAIKGLKGDASERTWPRNLTKPWTYVGSHDPKDIFARISIGIPGTEMPSFADPKSKKMLSIEERWHVANYVVSLAKTQRVVDAENTVIQADILEGDLPDSPDDERWEQMMPTTFFLVPQIIGKERLFRPSNDTITVRAVYNDKAIAMLMEWDDRTKSIPGDERAEKIADKPIQEDGVAVQLPIEIPDKMVKPYFGMGDATHPVNIWHWKSGTKDMAETVAMANSRGFEDIEARDATESGLQAKGSYHDGTWRVVMVRPLTTADPENDLQFIEGRFIPIAFAAWDGSNNSEKGSRHTMTTWYWLQLKPATSAMPIIMALLIVGLFAGILFWWARSAAANKAVGGDS
ncbi:MAG: ethylbenzene dehydrogenase-related protein [Gammaproteobacteria bacterium]|nr:ethylbenzene dehydrogenase-related protein [Gammaproteobacteria bacterium]